MKPTILQHFDYEHLKPELRAVSKPFADLARMIVDQLPANEQRALALQCLLQAKDAAVRASIEAGPKADDLFTDSMVKALAEKLIEFQRDGGKAVL